MSGSFASACGWAGRHGRRLRHSRDNEGPPQRAAPFLCGDLGLVRRGPRSIATVATAAQRDSGKEPLPNLRALHGVHQRGPAAFNAVLARAESE